MKKIKKLVAIALAAVMVFALGSVAFAGMVNTNGTTNSGDTGTITINGLEGGVTATAYPIATATYDESGNFLGYAMVSGTGDCTFQINADGSYDESALTEANLAALFEVVSNGTSYYATVDVNGTSATIENVPVGAYLIVITGSESTAYGMMIGSVYYTDSEGSWAIVDGEITDVTDCELWAKSTKPTVEKTEHHENGDATHGESADVGDEITFDIEVHSIPSYQGEYPEFDVTDQLTGLVMNTDEIEGITITAYPTEGSTEGGVTLTLDTDYTVTPIYSTEEGHTSDIVGFDVNFVVEGNYMLNSYAGGYLVIEYGAILTDEGVSYNGDALHENDVTLTYATTSYVAGTEESPNEGTDEDTDYEYTFAVNAMKTDNSDETALAGATFGLYTDDACTTPYTRDDAALTATSGADGTFAFSGLEEGTYYMKEIEAPAGYLLNQAVYKVVISADYDTDGTITSWTITVTLDDETVASVTNGALTGFSIQNTKTGLLPSTGGRGTLIFTIIGCAIVVCAVVGVVATRRRRAA